MGCDTFQMGNFPNKLFKFWPPIFLFSSTSHRAADVVHKTGGFPF
jgi:hypothetical protein